MSKATVVLEGRQRLSLHEVYEESGVLKVAVMHVSPDAGVVSDAAKDTLIMKCRTLPEPLLYAFQAGRGN